MKTLVPILCALMLVSLVTTAKADDAAQMQIEQQACGTDVYTYCNDAIPDHDLIATCLRRHWRKISLACRRVMIHHGRRRHRR